MPRIYVASLSDYNNGHLHGVWIDLEGKDEFEVQDEINEMLRTSRYPNVTYKCSECDGNGAPCEICKGKGEYASAEEWAIHDYDDMPSMGEFPTMHDVLEYVRMTEEHGDAWAAYLEHVGANYATEDDFSNTYAGEADTELDWVEQHLEDCSTLESIPENLRYYFDSERYLRDLKAGGEVSFVRHLGTVYVFWA